MKSVNKLKNEKAKELKKYDYLKSLEKLKSYTSKWYFGGIMYVALILGFILSQLVYYDLKKSKNKNNQ